MTSESLYYSGLVATTALVLLVVMAGISFWIAWFLRLRLFNLTGDGPGTLLHHESYRKPSWSVFEFLFMFGTMITAGAFSQLAVAQLVDPDSVGVEQRATSAESPEADESSNGSGEPQLPQEYRLQAFFVANAITLLITLGLLRAYLGVTPKNLGLVPTWSDVRRGAVATVWILSPVLVINFAASKLVQYQHAVTDLLAAEKGFGTFVFVFLSAAVLTPIFEEFLFRCLLQGGLQRIADFEQYHNENADWRPKAVWPIVVTSLIFAAVHLGQGAAPIPLFFLSIGLGFLYRANGRLTPVIVVHLLLNAATLVMAYFNANAGIE